MREATSHKKTLVAMLALAMDELIVKAGFPSRSLWTGQQGLLLCTSKSWFYGRNYWHCLLLKWLWYFRWRTMSLDILRLYSDPSERRHRLSLDSSLPAMVFTSFIHSPKTSSAQRREWGFCELPGSCPVSLPPLYHPSGIFYKFLLSRFSSEFLGFVLTPSLIAGPLSGPPSSFHTGRLFRFHRPSILRTPFSEL